jgi:putative membrane protein insertion efficiency factor
MINRLLKIPIRFWQRFISPCLPPACRFHPNCSAYALEALDRHPWPRALVLIAWRILRCNPFSAGGFDPVPPAGHQPPHDPSRKAI